MIKKFPLLAMALLLVGCTGNGLTAAPKPLPRPPLPRPVMQLWFQNGQTAAIQLDGKNGPLESQFTQWVAQGVYTNAPVYRQLPGVFVLVGKPRLKGEGFVVGHYVDQLTKQPTAHYGRVGLVVHADGTVGPELIIFYGWTVRECCQTPANVAIGTITQGQPALGKVQRGDNLTGIAIRQ